MSDSCDPTDCSSVHGILQTRILGWLPFPAPGDLPDSGIKPGSPALQADSLLTEQLHIHEHIPIKNQFFKKLVFKKPDTERSFLFDNILSTDNTYLNGTTSSVVYSTRNKVNMIIYNIYFCECSNKFNKTGWNIRKEVTGGHYLHYNYTSKTIRTNNRV